MPWNAAIQDYICFIDHCIATNHLLSARSFHGRLLKTGLACHTLLANRFIDVYAKCCSLSSARSAFDDVREKNPHSWNALLAAHARVGGQLDSARELFDQMPHRNLVAYNTMISALTHHGHHKESLDVFKTLRMDRSIGTNMDKFTIVGVVSACAGLGTLRSLRQVHGAVVTTGLELNLIMFNVFIDAYGKCSDTDVASRLFDRMATRDVVSWTSLLGAYARANRLEEACRVFDKMPAHNAISWTALISGHEQNGQEEMALELFERMVEERVSPTPFTLVSVLSACASLGLTGRGKEAHAYMIRRYIGSNPFNVYSHNALIDMYAKCGNMSSAALLFHRMPARDFVSWNSMVTGFAQNGLGKKALAVFDDMIEAGVKPTHVTLLGVLSACSHAGLVTEGHRFLDVMEKEHDVKPRPEHYAAFIDALGRKRQLQEAIKFMKSLPPDAGLDGVGAWGALLSACRMHGDLELAKKAAELLFTLEPENGVRYVTLSNIYSAAGRWDDARKVRMIMKGKGLRKDPGCSWIEVRSSKHVFLSEDKSHCETEKIYEMLGTLLDHMKVPKTSNTSTI